jgi:RNA polymerase sigma-70 factor (ECF subfamily)
VDDLTRLALAAGAGDRAATAALVRRTQPEVWRLCARLGDHATADDLTQEVYLRALPALARFRGEASARTWLLQIARHVCADHVRRTRRSRALLSRLIERAEVTGAHPQADCSPATVGGPAFDGLDELIEGLSPERREAFVLTQLLGLSYAEAAQVCEVPVGTIRSRVARARGDLLVRLGFDAPGAAACGDDSDDSAGRSAGAADSAGRRAGRSIGT